MRCWVQHFTLFQRKKRGEIQLNEKYSVFFFCIDWRPRKPNNFSDKMIWAIVINLCQFWLAEKIRKMFNTLQQALVSQLKLLLFFLPFFICIPCKLLDYGNLIGRCLHWWLNFLVLRLCIFLSPASQFFFFFKQL